MTEQLKNWQSLKLPPQDVELEKVVLGSILLDREGIEQAVEHLTADSFYHSSHQLIFQAMVDLAKRNQPIDLMTVGNELKPNIEKIGGLYELVKLTNSVVSTVNLGSHCHILKEKATRRNLIAQISTISQKAYDESIRLTEVLETAENAFSEIGQNYLSTDARPISDVLVKAVAKIEHFRTLDSAITGVPSGFEDLDYVTKGFQPSDLIIVAARPSVGKTAFALNLVRNASQKGFPVAVFSLEMSAESQAFRMLSTESGIDMANIQTGRNLNMEEVGRAAGQLAQLPIYFEDNASLSITKLRASVRRMVKKFGIKAVFVDYLQLVTPEAGNNREQEISKISRELKKLAMDVQIPIIALSQLSREVEKRAQPIPQLSDLRESGAIEQDADVVAFLYRASEADVMNDETLKDRRYVKVAKQRNGMLDTVSLDFDPFTQTFKNVKTWRAV